jgi:hypothetical protein
MELTKETHYISKEQAKFVQWMIQHLGAGGAEPDWVQTKGKLRQACEATMKMGTYTDNGKKTLNRLADSYRDEYKQHLADIRAERESVGTPIDTITNAYNNQPRKRRTRKRPA